MLMLIRILNRPREGRRGLSRPGLQIFRNPPWPLGAFAIGQGAASGVGLEGSGPQLIRRPNSRILG
jgi:hypothetical protein